MSKAFDFVVVGRGMMGAAAARHLSLMTSASIALVGPGEPVDWASHPGVFASHYDSGRITRTIDPDPVWARLAHRSIARYRQIEQESGIAFFRETGCLIAGPAGEPIDPAMARILDVGRSYGLDLASLDDGALRQRFPWFSLGRYRFGLFEATGAGHIDPRRLVLAQTTCAVRGGVCLVESEAVGVTHQGDHAEVTTADGRSLRCGMVLIAAGAFSIADRWLPERLDLVVKARTGVLAEIDERTAIAWSTMPSLIIETDRRDEDVYLLPPIRYPDGKIYVKIGGDPSDVVLDHETDVRDWFRRGENRQAAAHLEGVLRRMIPSLEAKAIHAIRCVTTFTRHARPYIGASQAPTIAILTGGNGRAAKSSDEIGRLGASLLVQGRLDETDQPEQFAVVYRTRPAGPT